jgi:translocator protein
LKKEKLADYAMQIKIAREAAIGFAIECAYNDAEEMLDSSKPPIFQSNAIPAGLRLWGGLFVFIVLCYSIGGLGGWVTYPAIGGWYNTIKKPSWTPPNWIFAPVWNFLFLLTAISGWLVWRKNGFNAVRLEMTIFATQLSLNLLWSVVFFGLRSPGWALLVAVLLWLSVGAMIATFRQVSRVASMLMLPYFVWAAFAIALNFAIWRLNA